jgi:Carboxypeptidase regulatory-like domain
MKAALAVFIIILATTTSWAQFNTAEVAGVVKDGSGAVLPAATVTAVQAATGFTSEQRTDSNGEFLLASLPVGQYTITVEFDGFKPIRRSIALLIGQKVRLEFALEVGSVTEEITITTDGASTGLIQTENAEVSDVIENRQIVNLPLNGRQFMDLALLSDAVVKPPAGTRGSALQQAGNVVNVAGQRSGHNIYLLDGVKVTDEYFNNLVVSPSVDAVQEFKIQKSQYPAEFGGKGSALVNVATKSGTNELHGTLFEFVRNDKFDARNFFDDPNAPIPPLRQNQFGGTLGGPFRKNRSFFFLNYEGERIRKSVTKTFTVPTEAMRRGDFSGLAPIYDPLSTDVSGQRTVFANNRIPESSIDPVAREFLKKVPQPNRPGTVQNLQASEREATHMDQFNARIDHQLSQQTGLFGRLSIFKVDVFQPFGTGQLNESLIPGFGRNVGTKTYNAAFSYSHFFSNDVLNEFRFGYLDVSGGQTSPNQGDNFAARAGLLGVNPDPRDVGYPQMSFAGVESTMGDPTSFVFRRNKSFDVYDNLLINLGRHKIKFGGSWFHLKFNPSDPDSARGNFGFTNRWTSSRAGAVDGNAFADFLLGFPTSATVGIGRGDEDSRTNWLHAYIQDDWEPISGLTINAGLRYEYNQHIREVENRLSAVDVPGRRYVIASGKDGKISPAANTLLPLLPLPFVTTAEAGRDRSLLRPSYRRYAPRFGLAWTIPGIRETVVHAGYGIFLNQWAYSVQQAFARNLPFFVVKNVNTPADAFVPTLRTGSILTATTLGSLGGNTMDYDYRTEYTETWTLSVQHQLTANTMFEIAYMGNHTIGADNGNVLNVPLPGPGPIDARRPIPQLSSIRTIRWNGWGTYNALTLRAAKRLSSGLTFSGNYSWSKSIDDASDPGPTAYEQNLPQDVHNLNAEKGLSSYDHRHRFVSSFVYEIPGVGRLLHGWQLGGIATLQSGAPFTVVNGVDRANIGSGPAQRPDLLRNPNLPRGQRDPQRWFDVSAFAQPAPFTFGNAGRNVTLAPGLSNVDMSLQRNFVIKNEQRIEFRWEVFNVLNHPNFDVPGRIAFSPDFGRIFSTAESSRQMQFGLKFVF